jgi:hypothetical protein
MLSSMCQAHLPPADVLEYKSPGFPVNLTSFRAIEKRQTFKKGIRNFVSFIVSTYTERSCVYNFQRTIEMIPH